MSITGKLSEFLRKDSKFDEGEPPADLAGFKSYLVSYMTRRLKLPPGTTITLGTVLTDLGQDSLSLIRISGDLEAILGIEVEPALVFETPTLGDLAVALQELRVAKRAGTVAPPAAAAE